MNTHRWLRNSLVILAVACPSLALSPAQGSARGLSVDVWTDRGDESVYQPGDAIQLKVRATDDAYLMVYEIDSEGYVRLLFPDRGSRGSVEGRRTYRVPSERSRYDLVVQGPVGEGYIVALASTEPFRELPWYLRPYDPQAEDVGYIGRSDDEQGITAEGRIVGDPFVAMERIRRRVVNDPDDERAFATAYSMYYVHEQVRYPRYLCYDCHRPNRWAWWDGFDPYYTNCRVFDFRVNWSWGWGPTYWFGSVPYYVYVVRHDCPPGYRNPSGGWYSSWDGWNQWSSLWGGHLRRYKSPPPQGYIPPTKYTRDAVIRGAMPRPPGFLANDDLRSGRDIRRTVPIGRREEARGEAPAPRGTIERGERVERAPMRPSDDGERSNGRRPDLRPAPRGEGTRDEPPPRVIRPREERPVPREAPEGDEPPPRVERPKSTPQSPPREERKPDSPRVEKPRNDHGRSDRPRDEDSERRPRERP